MLAATKVAIIQERFPTFVHFFCVPCLDSHPKKKTVVAMPIFLPSDVI